MAPPPVRLDTHPEVYRHMAREARPAAPGPDPDVDELGGLVPGSRDEARSARPGRVDIELRRRAAADPA
ncbi:hypothetical protein ACU686_31110 [Yinghuangia aomiensis]